MPTDCAGWRAPLHLGAGIAAGPRWWLPHPTPVLTQGTELVLTAVGENEGGAFVHDARVAGDF